MLWQDWLRRRRLAQLIRRGALQTPEDRYRAALILQHSFRRSGYRRAHTLAVQAAEQGYGPARWLAAATLDRWLLARNRPQKYGTQYIRADLPRWAMWFGLFLPQGPIRLWDVDPSTTDADRAEWGVEPLEVLRERATTLHEARAPTRLGPTLLTLDIGEFTLEIQDIHVLWSSAPPNASRPPVGVPLHRNEPRPSIHLPVGLKLCRVGDALGAIDRDGSVRASWRHQQIAPGEPYRYYWRWTYPPTVTRMALAGRAAVQVSGEPDGAIVTIFARESGRMCELWSTLPPYETAQLAASL